MKQSNFKLNDWQMINLQNVQATHAAQYHKNKQPKKKKKKRPKWTLLKRWNINNQ